MADSLTFLTQHYYPELAATGQLLTDLAEELAARGYRVNVWTRQPGYEKRGRAAAKEVRNNVEIRRVPSLRLGRKSVSRRLIDAVSFCLGILLRLLIGRRTHLLIVTNPPFLMWVGWIGSVLRRHTYTLLIHDVYPDIALRLGLLKPNGWMVRIWRVFNCRAYKRAHSMVGLSQRMGKALAEHSGFDMRKLTIIHNWADDSRIRPLQRSQNPFAKSLGVRDELVILYSGNFGMFHDLETILEAARQLESRQDIKFLFIGDGAKRDKLLTDALSWSLTNVRFLPYQPAELLPYTITTGDIGVVTLEKGTEGLCVPSKLYTYMAGGLAILAVTGKDSEVADTIRRCECGVHVHQGDTRNAVECIRAWADRPELLAQHKRNSYLHLHAEFSRQSAMDQYAALFRALS